MCVFVCCLFVNAPSVVNILVCFLDFRVFPQAIRDELVFESKLCEAIRPLKGPLAHLLKGEPLPVTPLPDYSVALVRLF